MFFKILIISAEVITSVPSGDISILDIPIGYSRCVKLKGTFALVNKCVSNMLIKITSIKGKIALSHYMPF